MTSRAELLSELRLQLRQRSTATSAAPRHRTHSGTRGWPPSGCLAAGEFSEWISPEVGSGAEELALRTMLHVVSTASHWLIVEARPREGIGQVYPLALQRLGLPLTSVAFVQVHEPAEGLWAIEQGLRSRGVDVVVAFVERLSPVASRRLKLAAETSRTHCLLLRGREALRETSHADVRWLVTPLPAPVWDRRRWQVETIKLRNGLPGGVIQVELDHETNTVRVVSELVDPADRRRASGA